MTADLFTRLAQRAIGGAGVTVDPAPEPEPALDEEEATELASRLDVPPPMDAVPAPEVARSAALAPAGQPVADPVPRPITPVLLPIPGWPLDPVPEGPAPVTSFLAHPSAAAPLPAPGPAEAGKDDGPPDAGIRLTQRAGTLEPPLAPPIELAAPAQDLQPAPADGPRTSVEVTVGRIEIRVRPPAHGHAEGPRRATAPAPPLTLAEYLRRREVSS